MHPRTTLIGCALAFALLSAPGAAQTGVQPAPGELIREISVQGVEGFLVSLIRVSLNAQPGDPAGSVDLTAERAAIMDQGYFTDATLRFERDNGRLVLIVIVEPNPPLARVAFAGNVAIDGTTLQRVLAQQLNLIAEEGVIYNPRRVADGKLLVQDVYRQSGFPFDVGVDVSIETGEQGVEVIFTVAETAAIKEVQVEGNTLVATAPVRAAFEELVQVGSFDLGLYRNAFETVRGLYEELGYRFSGVDTQTTALADGTLTVRIIERRIESIDTTPLNIDPSELALQPGDFFKITTLEAEVARLTAGAQQNVVPELLLTADGMIRVSFQVVEGATGPITSIQVRGNTVVPEEDIREVVTLRVGQTFNSFLAGSDAQRIGQLYLRRGYYLAGADGRPDFEFVDGVLTFELNELRIEAYRIVWNPPEHRTQEFVITRELTVPPGGVYSVNQLREDYQRILQTQVVNPPIVRLEPGSAPDLVVIVLEVSDARSITLTPSLAYSSLSGISGVLAVSDRNFLGAAHEVGFELQAAPNDVGQVISWSIGYSIPWLYLDFLDFNEQATSVSFGAGSRAQGNIPLRQPDGTDTGRQVTQRSDFINFGIGRPLFEYTRISLAIDSSWDGLFLEPVGEGETPTVTEAEAQALIPLAGRTSQVSTGVVYDDRDSRLYPTRGNLLSTTLTYGWGDDVGEGPVAYVRPVFGVRAYKSLTDDNRLVLAARAQLGLTSGNPPPLRQFAAGGNEPEISTLRGWPARSFFGHGILSSSLELRYLLTVETFLTQSLIAIVFIDQNTIWDRFGTPSAYNTRLSAGIGLQLNLQIAGFLLPQIRLDYGFSDQHPGGVLSFRFGAVF
jgi:outer membrane protein assembly factor BamA